MNNIICLGLASEVTLGYQPKSAFEKNLMRLHEWRQPWG